MGESRFGTFLLGVPLDFECPLYYLAHEISHGFRRLILHLAGGVGVGAQGEARIVMTQHTGNGLDVHAILQGQGGEGVPLCHNKDKSENPCAATGFGFVFILFPRKKPS